VVVKVLLQGEVKQLQGGDHSTRGTCS